VKLAIYVSAIESRRALAESLAAQLPGAVVNIDDPPSGSSWPNYRKALLAGAETDADWIVSIDDDAIPCERFMETLANALATCPGDIANFYSRKPFKSEIINPDDRLKDAPRLAPRRYMDAVRARNLRVAASVRGHNHRIRVRVVRGPNRIVAPSEAIQAERRRLREGGSWFETISILHGISWAVRREYAREVVDVADRLFVGPEKFHSGDQRIQGWVLSTGRHIYITMPSIVQHRQEQSSTMRKFMGRPNKFRVARNYDHEAYRLTWEGGVLRSIVTDRERWWNTFAERGALTPEGLRMRGRGGKKWSYKAGWNAVGDYAPEGPPVGTSNDSSSTHK
jgi:hypothetical protein